MDRGDKKMGWKRGIDMEQSCMHGKARRWDSNLTATRRSAYVVRTLVGWASEPFHLFTDDATDLRLKIIIWYQSTQICDNGNAVAPMILRGFERYSEITQNGANLSPWTKPNHTFNVQDF